MTFRSLSSNTCPISCFPHRHCRRVHPRRIKDPDRSLNKGVHLGSTACPSVAGFELGETAGVAALRRQACNAYTGSSSGMRQTTRMGNKSGTGPFTPLVVIARNVLGKKDFNQFRGKAISLHSQIIKNFGVQIGADGKQVQGLIRLAKKNGEKLGFLS